MSTLPIFVINMPSATDRRAAIARQLQALGLDAHWIAATRGKDMQPDEVARIYDEKSNRRYFRRALSPGEIGCYVSHREVWQKMVDDNISRAIIIEDDIRLTENFPSAIRVLAKEMPTDMVKLFDDRNGEGPSSREASQLFRWVNYKRVPNATGAYAISYHGAKKLLARTQIFRPIDVDLQFYSELSLTIAGLKPYPAEATSDFESSIDNQGKHGSRKTFTWPWRNWRYRLSLFTHRTFYTSANIQDVPNE